MPTNSFKSINNSLKRSGVSVDRKITPFGGDEMERDDYQFLAKAEMVHKIAAGLVDKHSEKKIEGTAKVEIAGGGRDRYILFAGSYYVSLSDNVALNLRIVMSQDREDFYMTLKAKSTSGAPSKAERSAMQRVVDWDAKGKTNSINRTLMQVGKVVQNMEETYMYALFDATEADQGLYETAPGAKRYDHGSYRRLYAGLKNLGITFESTTKDHEFMSEEALKMIRKSLAKMRGIVGHCKKKGFALDKVRGRATYHSDSVSELDLWFTGRISVENGKDPAHITYFESSDGDKLEVIISENPIVGPSASNSAYVAKNLRRILKLIDRTVSDYRSA